MLVLTSRKASSGDAKQVCDVMQYGCLNASVCMTCLGDVKRQINPCGNAILIYFCGIQRDFAGCTA